MEQQFDLTNNNSANKALDYIKKNDGLSVQLVG
jgi:hypothetical protein